MAHEVENMVYFGQTPWHGFGSVLEEHERSDWEIVCEKSGLNWEVEKVPVYTRESVVVNGLTEEYSSEIPNQYLIRRATDKKPYAIVTKNYKPLDNRFALSWFNPWLKSGLAKFETAGSLKEGAVIWGLAKIEGLEADVIPGDTVKRYVLLSNSHNGVQAVRGGFTEIRVVCQNTLGMAHAQSDSNRLLRVKHSGNIEQNMINLRDTMDLIHQEFRANVDQYRKLAHHAFYKDDVVRLVKKVVLDIEPNEKLSTRSQNILEHILDCVKNSPGADAAPNTAWGAYNGINYYLLQESGTKSDKSNRLYSAWFGINKTKDQQVLNNLVALAA